MPIRKNVMLLMDIDTARLVRQAVHLLIANAHDMSPEEQDLMYAVNADLSRRIAEETKR